LIVKNCDCVKWARTSKSERPIPQKMIDQQRKVLSLQITGFLTP